MSVVTIDRWDRNYLSVRFEKNDFIISQIKDVPGREWVQRQRLWKIPVGSSPLLLAKLDNANIPYSITEIGRTYLMAYRDTRQTLIDIKLREVEKEVTVHGMEYPLRPYQINGVDFLTTGKRTLLADDMGLGKTVQALASVILWQPKATLIVVMNSLKYNWLSEIQKHTPQLKAIVVEGGKERRKAIWDAPGFHIKICNYQLLTHDADIMPMNWEAIIADEATSFKAAATKTAQRIKTLTSSYAIAMSGTPLENHLMEMHSIMEFVRSGILGGVNSED
jgi:SNF2 family DNA or RNA helicase